MPSDEQTNIDYSTLNQPATSADIAAYKKWRGTVSKKETVLVAFLTVFLIFAWIVTVLLTAEMQGKPTPPYALAIMAFIGGFMIYLWWVNSRKRAEKLARMYKFALANNMQLIVDRNDPTGNTYSGLIFDEGHSRSIKEAFVFADGTEIGNYSYTTGSGKNRQEHLWAYARIKLSRKLPHMVLDSKSNNILGFTNLPDSFAGQSLSLEGDFNKHFTLYVPKGYERDALYVFTPDVMTALIDTGHSYDMEVIDDQLIMYSNSVIALDDKNQLTAVLSILDHIGYEIRDQSSYYADERVAGARLANVVAEPGSRLKKRFTFGGVLTFVIIIFILVALFLHN